MAITTREEQVVVTEETVSLKDFLDVLRRRRLFFIQVFGLMLAVGIVVTVLGQKVYRTRASLTVPMGTPALNVVDTSNPLAPILSAAQPDTVSAQLEALQSEPFLRAAEERAGIAPRQGEPRPSVRVSAIDSSNVIEIVVDGHHPDQIARLANAIVDEHLERMDELARRGIDQAMAFVTEERDKAARDLEAAEQRLMEFRTRHQVMELQADQQARVKEYVDLQNKVRSLRSNLVTSRAKIGELRERLELEPVETVYESARPNPNRPPLEAQLQELILERENLSREFAPGSRWVREVEERIAILERRLEAEPEERPIQSRMVNPVRAPLLTRLADEEAALQAYDADYEAALGELEAVQGRMQGVAPWETDLTRLTRDRDRLEKAYLMLSDRLRDLEIRANAEVQVARAIERAAAPLSPIRPRRSVNLVLAVILALLVATSLTLLREYLDDRINSPADLERVSPAIPSLSWVPQIDAAGGPLVTSLAANSHAAESYRTLRSGIVFASLDSPLRRLQVTSPAKGEGKTTTTVNLAIAMALDGKRVILVDADLRRPSVHRLLDLPSSPGLTEVLAGMKPLEEALQETDVENLRVLSAGPILPNPSEVLGSRAFDELLEQLDAMADVVIVDSPPCIPVTDPALVASRMDGVILVVHAGQTRKAAVKQAETALRRARARIIGVVFNRVHSRQGDHYYYYYGGYGDGYYAETAERGEPRRRRRNGRENGSPKAVPEGSRSGPASELTPRDE